MAATATPESEKPRLVIRKYPNRRYYDTTRSRHLTLDDIRSLVREGHDLTVTDSRTGADITAQVLTQIILELDTPKIDSFPVPLLLHVIRANDRLVHEFMDTYFNQAFRAFVDYQKQVEDRMRQMRSMSGGFPPFPGWAEAMFGAFRRPEEAPAEASPAGAAHSNNAEPDPGPKLREMVAELRREVAGLQQELKRVRGAKPAPRTPRRKARP